MIDSSITPHKPKSDNTAKVQLELVQVQCTYFKSKE